MRTLALLKPTMALLMAATTLVASARTKYWIGGDGRWDDPMHWADTPGGTGGAGVPRANEEVMIAPSVSATIVLPEVAWCASLFIDAGHVAVRMLGDRDTELIIAGHWRVAGEVEWASEGTVRLTGRDALAEVDLKGMSIRGDVRLEGERAWSMLSDLVVRGTLHIKRGTLITNGAMLQARDLDLAGRGAKRLMAGPSLLRFDRMPDMATLRGMVEAGNSMLMVDGELVPWGTQEAFRDLNICGTGVGQTMFTINAQMVSNYGGFGVSCHGVCNGAVSVTITGGVGPFTSQWVGGPNALTWNNVCPGNQIVIVTDQGQGISCATTVQVTDPAQLSVIFFGQVPPSCVGVCDGVSNAFAVGGVPPYSYDWNNGAGTGSSFTQLCPGNNALHVTDDNGCSFDTTFFFNVQAITPNLTFEPVSCFGECNGSASVDPTGGASGYTYDWGPGTISGDGTNAVTGLCAGNYMVTITDAAGCDTTVQFMIEAPPPIQVDLASTDASCAGVCDGSASVQASGAVGPFGFEWTPDPGNGQQGDPVVAGLCAGVWSVTVTDLATGCDTVITFTIDEPMAIEATGATTDVGCAGECDGAITVTVTSSTGTPTFLWSPGGQTTPSVTGLCAGEYSVLITDVNGCDTTLVFTIGEPPTLDPQLTITDATCADACDGTAAVSVAGGTPDYTFLWSPGGQTSAVVTGLCAGVHSVLITDAAGCDTTLQFTITEPPPLDAVVDAVNVTCGEACDGQATITVTGGTPDHSFLWTPGGHTTATVQGLCAGTYDVSITDANGCELTVQVVIDDPPPITLSLQVTPATCPTLCDGTAGVIASGGAGGFGYMWSPDPGAGQQGQPNVIGLCPQAYLLTVTDALGCDTTIAFTVDAPDPITADATIVPPTCAGACDGSIEVSASGGNGVYTYLWSPGGQITAAVAGLCAGTYTVLVTSGDCDTLLTFLIEDPPMVEASIVTTDASCADGCDGTATVTASSGTGALTYTWSPGTIVGQGTAQATDLCPGSYSVVVADAAGCDTTITFTIAAPPPIEVVLNVEPETCDGPCDGSATVQATGGMGAISILWSPEPQAGQGTATATGLCSGITYEVTLTDAAGCDTTLQFTVDPFEPIEPNISSTPVSCFGACDGTATVGPVGGSGTYTYLWSPGGQTTPQVTGLCAGTYQVTITDSEGCSIDASVLILGPDPFDVVASSTNETCNGPCDGTASITISGGAGGFTYLWSPGGQTTASVTGLCAGTWSVTATDANGCDTTLTFVIEPQQPIDAGLSTTDATCANGCDGTATVAPSNGIEPYTIVWSPEPGDGQGTTTATGLCAEDWTVRITDALGCDTTISFTIAAPPAIEVVLNVEPETCEGPCDGSATVQATGGTGAMTIFWQPEPQGGQGTATATGLCSGITYEVTLTDAAGCDTTIQFIVEPYAGIEPNASSTPVSCFGACDGTATVGPVGGSGTYTYLWSPGGQTTPEVTGLCAGVHEVTITDSEGCSTVAMVLVTGPDPFDVVATSTNETCNGPCDGTASITISGGAGGFTYLWSPGGQTTASVTGLCAGTWSVTATDANGCDTTITFVIEPQQPIDAGLSTTDATCANGCDGTATVTPSNGIEPYTIVWSPEPGDGQGTTTATGLCVGDWQVTITDAAGCDTTIVFAVAAPPVIEPGLTVIPESCFGPCTGSATVQPTGGTGDITILWQPDPQGGQGTPTATGLCAGIVYEVTLTDAAGCDTTIQFVVDPFDPIQPNSSSTPTSCFGACDGTATVGPTGGSGSYTYLWSPGGETTPQVTGLCAGVHEVTITDSEGCSTVAPVLILQPDPIALNATTADVDCAGACNGSIQLTPAGGSGSYTYLWSPGGFNTPIVSDLCAGSYTVTVTDSEGCSIEETFDIAEPTPIILAGSSTPSACQVCSGTVALDITGGAPDHTVTWTDADGNVVGNTATVTDLCAGLYTAAVTDANGCTAQQVVSVSDADGEELTLSSTSPSCAGGCDGEVSVTFDCGTPDCTIAWYDAQGNDLGQSGNTVTGLCVGSYLVEVTNGAGCISIGTVDVVDPDPIQPNSSSAPVSCFGACDGTATVGPTGGSGTYTYLWSPGGQTTPQVTGLCAGVHEVTITDSEGCSILATVLILDPDPVMVDAAVTAIACAGECDGSIVVTPSGGSAPYTFMWSPGGQTTAEITGLCAGTYEVTVMDGNGCSATDTYTITEPAPTALTGSSTPSACQVCSGTATIDIVGGTPDHEVVWIDADGNIVGNTTTVTDLCAGLYTAAVTDANGCTVQQVVAVSDADGEELTMASAAPSCAGVCDGEASVSFSCGTPDCTVVWYDAQGNDLGQSGNMITGLCAGTYVVEVTNAAGCLSVGTVDVVDPDPIQPNSSSTPVSCFGACDGTATVGPTGGSGTYTYLWSPGGQTTPQVTGLCAGVHDVMITDDSGCSIQASVLLLEPTPLEVDAVTGNVGCADACDGSIVLSPSGGAGAYTYAWAPVPPNGQGSNAALNLCAGSYDVTVTDGNGCSLTSTYGITEPAPLALMGSSTPSTCQLCTGTATIDIAGGTPDHIVTWTDADGNVVGNAATATDLCAGLYTATVTDANGCSAQLLVPVSDAEGEELITDSTQPQCAGGCDGEVSVTFTCSEPDCTIAWYDGQGNDLGQSGNVVAGLCAGTYVVEVTNGQGCISIATVEVVDPPAIQPNSSSTPASCFGACDGTATVGPTGGSGTYTYLWSPGGQDTPQVTDLCAGVHDVTITDSEGCSVMASVLILEPDPLVLDVVVTPITCADACDGSIVVSSSGGSGAYTYAWTPEPSNGQGSNVALDLCAGQWSVEVTDANGCTATHSEDLTAPDPIVVDLALVHNLCHGVCAGEAVATITGGSGTYTTQWTDAAGDVLGEDVLAVSGLCGGAHTITVTDASGCVVTVPFTIDQAVPIEASLLFTNETCHGPCDGTAAVAPTGGGGGFSIVWQPDPGGGQQGADQVSGLCAGDWAVVITDALGCDTTYTFTILPYEPIVPNAVVSDAQCSAGCDGAVTLAPSGGSGTYDVSWSPEPPSGPGGLTASGLCAGTITATITDGFGCDTTFTFIISEPAALQVVVDQTTPASCLSAADGAIAISASGGTPGLSYSWTGPAGFSSTAEDISDLAPGEYVVTVTDANGCSWSQAVVVDVLSLITADAGADQEDCAGASFTLDGSGSTGATSYTWTDAQGNVLGTGPTITLDDLPPGTHTFTLTASDGPCTATDQVVIIVLELPPADAGPDQEIFIGDQVTLGGAPTTWPDAAVLWAPDSVLTSGTAHNPVATPHTTTWFVLTVTGTNGCVNVDSVLVTVRPQVDIPSGFTPNGDGWNDTWVIDLIHLFPDCEVEVYSRWGELLFQSNGYKVPWDGRYNGGLVPVGTYYYVIKLNDPRFPEPYTGPLTIIR
jgi:gliding motility-associated-like protein